MLHTDLGSSQVPQLLANINSLQSINYDSAWLVTILGRESGNRGPGFQTDADDGHRGFMQYQCTLQRRYGPCLMLMQNDVASVAAPVCQWFLMGQGLEPDSTADQHCVLIAVLLYSKRYVWHFGSHFVVAEILK